VLAAATKAAIIRFNIDAPVDVQGIKKLTLFDPRGPSTPEK